MHEELLSKMTASIANLANARDAIAERLFARAIDRVPIDNRHFPAESILASITMNYLLLGSDESKNTELRGMYASLLGSALDRTTAPLVHPSFAQLIAQMSSEEAKMLEAAAHARGKSWPALEIRAETAGGASYVVAGYAYAIGLELSIDPASRTVCVTNLERLGILSVDWTKVLSDKPLYDAVESFAQSAWMEKNDVHYNTHPGIVELTSLGGLLADTCWRSTR